MANPLGQPQDKATEGIRAPTMPKTASKTLAKMRQNKKGDWTISDIEKVCGEIELVISPPSHGSHFKVSSQHLTGILTIPSRRPIKPPYIKSFVGLCDAHIAMVKKEDSCG